MTYKKCTAQLFENQEAAWCVISNDSKDLKSTKNKKM